MASPAVSHEAARRAAEAWQALQDHINRWYHAFDFEALEIALAAAVGHYFISSDPCWLLISGPAGSGKTTLIHALESPALPSTHTLGDLTTKSLLSGHTHHHGILMDVGDSAILLFKDFGTITSKRFDDKLEILGQLREVYDGYLRRDTGASKPLQWTGKITVIAVATPEVERQRAVMAELGERFVTVRWRTGLDLDIACKARQQRGHEKEIIDQLRNLVKDLCRIHDLERKHPIVPESIAVHIDYLAKMTATLRGSITRYNNSITDDPAIEMPSRLAKVMAFLLSSYAHLMRREPCIDDLRLASRIAFDSIPLLRSRVYQAIAHRTSISRTDIIRDSDIPEGSFDYHIKDLMALKVVESIGTVSTGEEHYALSPSFRRLKDDLDRMNIDRSAHHSY